MFILIPAILILASLGGIFFIVKKKMPYLNKLTTIGDGFSEQFGISGEEHSRRDIFADFFPEFSDGFKSLKLQEYKAVWLMEMEKFLRKLRMVSLKMDRISDSLIKKIRRGHDFYTIKSGIVLEDKKKIEADVLKPRIASPRTSLEDMKKEEQRLIIEIAKNPKDSKLYDILGDLYMSMNNFSDAKDSFEVAIELNPNSQVLPKKRSQALENMLK